jgi:hypothetical protein
MNKIHLSISDLIRQLLDTWTNLHELTSSAWGNEGTLAAIQHHRGDPILLTSEDGPNIQFHPPPDSNSVPEAAYYL